MLFNHQRERPENSGLKRDSNPKNNSMIKSIRTSSFITDDMKQRRLLFIRRTIPTIGSEHLNTILVQGGRNLNDPIFKSQMPEICPGDWGVLKFQFDRCISATF